MDGHVPGTDCAYAEFIAGRVHGMLRPRDVIDSPRTSPASRPSSCVAVAPRVRFGAPRLGIERGVAAVIAWLARGCAVSSAVRRAGRAQWPARRRRRPVAGAPGRGLPTRHLPLVLRRPADPVVESGPAHGAACRRVPRSSRSLRKRVRAGTFDIRDRHRVPRRHRRRARRRRGQGQRGTWITPEMVDAYCELHRLRLCAFGRELARRAAGRRTLRPGARTRVLRRVDVRARDRRVEGRARSPGRAAATAGRAA